MRLLPSSRLVSLPAALLAAALVVASPEARAQGDKAAAESLFQAGVALMNQGKFAEACPKFADSQRADPSTGTLINLGGCYERVGKNASAWAVYKEAAELARKNGQTDREATANGRVAELEPKLSKLRIDAGDIPGMVVRRDGVDVGRGSLGVPIAVDPGEHAIVASAPGYEDWTTTIKVGDDADSKTVTVPPLKQLAGSGEKPPGGEGGGSSGRKIAGFVVGGVGVAALGLGAAFGALAIGDKNDADPLCPDKKCSPAGQTLIDSASTKALISTIGIGVGVAAVGAGVVLIVTSGGSSKPSDTAARQRAFKAHVYPSVGPDGGGLTFAGSFW